jgi:hypothetical protein
VPSAHVLPTAHYEDGFFFGLVATVVAAPHDSRAFGVAKRNDNPVVAPLLTGLA